MATWKEEVEPAILKNEKTARLPEWPPCKIIRGYRVGDADFFYNEFNHNNAIIQECDIPCDCNVGIWVPNAGEKEREDWVIL